MHLHAARAEAWYLRLIREIRCALSFHRDRQQWLYVAQTWVEEPYWVDLGRVCDLCDRHAGTPDQRRCLREMQNWQAKSEAREASYAK